MKKPNTKTDKPQKLKASLIKFKNIAIKIFLALFLYFANRLEFALHKGLTFNPILIGFIIFEWWFYLQEFWVHVLPFFVEDFIPTFFKFLHIKITTIFT